ncbi:putative ribonuclease H-like domain-containing protein [Tanacetum coccineum]
MKEELLQFKLQQVWTLVDLPNGKRAIGTKWVYMNKKDERGIVIRNKARLVAQGHTQVEGINYDEMDVKSAFLYRKIEEEVYVCQSLGFEDLDFLDRVYRVEKALYGLHQAPKAWYETLSTYLLENGFQRGKIDKTLFIKGNQGDILLVQVYVDDIIFGSRKKKLCTQFKKMMHKKFQMSSMGELTFFLGLQVKQKEDGIFISQDKYVTEILKKFGFSDFKTASTPMETHKPLLKDADGEDVDEHLYRSMIGSLMYLTSSRPDIMFAVDFMAMQKRRLRLLIPQLKLSIYLLPIAVDRYHFIRDSYEKKLIQMIKIHTDQNVPDLLTKVFDVRCLEWNEKALRMKLEHTLTTVGKVTAARHKPTTVVEVNAVRHNLTTKSKKKNTEVPQPSGSLDNVPNENVPTTSNDPLLSGEDRLRLTELMDLCTNLQKKVIDLEKAKTAQDSEIASLKKKKGRILWGGMKLVWVIRRNTSKASEEINDIDADAEEPSKFTDNNLQQHTSCIKTFTGQRQGKMIESEKPLKKKDQIMYDQEVALNLQAQLQAELEEEERLIR